MLLVQKLYVTGAKAVCYWCNKKFLALYFGLFWGCFKPVLLVLPVLLASPTLFKPCGACGII